ncbi:F510_1955 family glycosylhydrolase [Streptomyces sporangiiformans]|uniref:Exo-alpha-sialidase n=1 Tax=Streptomyces sporangiiformans TaxID=2315329 RepID=A0A505DBX4_9ACTN|nr:exo-alpha-sialidase [Streptomyces sporangiiformans]TPQ19932.1 exo-alpha-sialidase [Streptomyces sporangiiformans]
MTARPAVRPLLAIAGASIAALVLAACGGGATEAGSAAETSESPRMLSHVHGLGVDPADGRVYVATHDGLYTVAKGGKPKLVGDRKDDFMGFTVTGENTFIASGHGAEGSGRPGNLGLIESKDAGRTWTSRSLEGDADFHSLVSVKGTVYGYEGGRIRVSSDLKSWDDRATLEALDLAVNPSGDKLLATTAEGVVTSTDGGRTFGKGAEPVQAFVSWPSEKSLFGIGTSGKLSSSADGGKTWKELAAVPGGQPQALTAVNADHVLAATMKGVYESRDGGKTFSELAPLAS